MLRQIYDYVKQLLAIKTQTEQNTADIKELRQELRTLTIAVQQMRFDIDRLREKEADEREKLVLRLENALLRFERRLPPGKPETGLLEPTDE